MPQCSATVRRQRVGADAHNTGTPAAAVFLGFVEEVDAVRRPAIPAVAVEERVWSACPGRDLIQHVVELVLMVATVVDVERASQEPPGATGQSESAQPW